MLIKVLHYIIIDNNLIVIEWINIFYQRYTS